MPDEIGAEVFVSLDKQAVSAIVVDEGCEHDGVITELALIIADGAFYSFDAPIGWIGVRGLAKSLCEKIDYSS
jgi:pyruvate/2-oxoglutarate/acetoin dehydrogenase E1 component